MTPMRQRLPHPPQRKRRRRRITVATFLFALFAVLFANIAPARAISGDIHYQATWAWGRAVDTPGPGWQVTNDLGYLVTVEEGYLASYSTELVECARQDTPSLLEQILGAINPGVALAGHSQGPNPAAVAVSRVESLAEPASVDLGRVSVSYATYCQGHYLLARATPDAVNLPASDAIGTTLYLQGTYQLGDDEAVPFVIETNLAWGGMSDLYLADAPDQPIYAAISRDALQVTIERDLGTLFDGVDFATTDAEARAKTILRTFTSNARFIITGGKTHE